MNKSAQTKAEEQFARIRNKDRDKSALQQALKDREKADNEREAKTLRLRALRLAKEAADKEAAAKTAADTRAAKAARPGRGAK
ncbi:MAG: hypothetical protein FJX37_04520 [Alphaproteobacteria bacterium]|nr:hypothetical protein [Alphaproteobacteria bacterium]MBM3732620.1 hypothetical protein [Acidimicrobiia bacterium]MBM3952295.1 hypothetical protein [Rhodospirillales bacterium]